MEWGSRPEFEEEQRQQLKKPEGPAHRAAWCFWGLVGTCWDFVGELMLEERAGHEAEGGGNG